MFKPLLVVLAGVSAVTALATGTVDRRHVPNPDPHASAHPTCYYLCPEEVGTGTSKVTFVSKTIQDPNAICHYTNSEDCTYHATTGTLDSSPGNHPQCPPQLQPNCQETSSHPNAFKRSGVRDIPAIARRQYKPKAKRANRAGRQAKPKTKRTKQA